MFNIIVSIISILAGFITIWINEILVHKRDMKHKKEELLISHLKEMLKWLNEMQQGIFSLSRTLINSIGIYSDMDRKKQLQRDFNVDSNEIIEKSIIFCNSYAEVNNSLGIDLELGELNKAVGHYISELRDIGKMYHFPDQNDEDLNIINEKTSEMEGLIKRRIKVIAEEISKILIK